MDIKIWIAAGLMLCYYSGIYVDNPIYRIVEHIYVGVSAANGVVLTYYNYIVPTITVRLMENGEFLYIVPIIIGLLIYTRFHPSRSVNWLARITLAYWIGIGSANVIIRQFKPGFTGQITATFLSLTDGDPLTMFNNIVFVIGVLSVIIYFFFTFDNKLVQAGGLVGRYMMMVAFGAAYGNTVMARSAVLLGRIQYLLGNWLQIIETRV